MGRKTFESLGKPLSNRLNIVVTRNINFEDKRSNLILNRSNQVKFCSSLENAIISFSGKSLVQRAVMNLNATPTPAKSLKG